MSFISNLTELKNRINTLRGDNAVTPFAYDSEAYETDDADGHADFDSSRHNNIPLKDNLVLGLNPFVTNKGLRDQASSFTRQLINHFCGRTSYNLNKSVDVAHGLLDKTLAYANQPEGFPMLGADGRIDSSQLPESAVEYKGTWNAETNTPHLANGTGTKGDMYLVSQSGEQKLWETLIWNRVPRWAGLEAHSIVSLCYGNGIWLALDINNEYYRSEDNFRTVTIGLSSTFVDTCFNNGRFFICTNQGRIVLSTDARNWVLPFSTPVSSLSCIRGDGNTVIAGGSEGIIRSEVNGDSGTFAIVSDVSVSKIFGSNGSWVACKTDGGLLVSSDNGETWVDIEGVTSNIAFISIFANNGKWVASTEGQGVWESSDTTTWTMVSSIPEKAICSYVYSYDNIWVICANGGTDETVTLKGAYVSYDNAVTWASQTVGESYFNGLSAVCCNGDIWISFTKGFSSEQTVNVYRAEYGAVVTFLEGDEVVYNGSVWERIPVGTINTVGGVSPVNGNVEVTGKNIKYVKGDVVLNHLPSTYPNTASINAVHYANNIWVACTTSYGLWWSTDGKSWLQGTGGESYTFRTVYYSNGLWVAGSYGNGLWWSTDGKTWTQVTGETISYAFNDVRNANGLWVAGSSSHGLWWSTDGKAWTQITGDIGTSSSINFVYYANSIWVAGRSSRGLWWSTDGKTWTQENDSSINRNFLFCYANSSLWVAGSDSRGLWWSTDGKTWTQGTGSITTYRFDSAYYANGLWVAGSSSHGLWWSENGKAWTKVTGDTESESFDSVYYADSIWVAGSYYDAYWSTDGKTWTSGTGTTNTRNINCIAYANDIWVIGTNSYGFCWSIDGKEWSKAKANSNSYSFYSVYYANSIWVAGSDSHGLWWSADGKSWLQSTGGESYTFRTVYYSNGLWVAGSSSHGLWWSTDGKTWTQSTGTTTSYTFYGVRYGNDIWVAGSDSHGLWWSEDGKAWTQVTGNNNSFKVVYYANNIWVAGSYLNAYWSTDGKTWNKVTAFSLNSVFYANGRWVASSSSGLWWSTDGKAWTQGTGGISYDFNTVYCSNGLWIAGSSSHGLWKSTDGKAWTQVTGDTANYTFNSVSCFNGLWLAGSTSHGVWWSADGNNWSQNIGSATSYTFYIVHYGSDIWVAGSYQNGLWYIIPPILNVTQALSYIKSKLGVQ